ncbi:hypothetical protein V9L05_01240 [Bernardetia sp. Wsw4-3y2]|uniref:hypothetical protein n=1 Tax=Bernardetia sp. Wsw4-3y2 TaxID=3127471 RepID=UPI0030D5B953
MGIIIETFKFAQQYSAKTNQFLRQEMQRLDVKDSGDLEKTLSESVRRKGDEIIIDTIFKTYGRYVDMGVGFKSKKQQRQQMEEALGIKRRKKKGRKGKVWWSSVWYSRLNSLASGISYKLIESTVKTVKNLEK